MEHFGDQYWTTVENFLLPAQDWDNLTVKVKRSI